MSERRDAHTPTEALDLEAVAGLVGGRVVGDGTRRVRAVAPVAEAGPEDLAFLALRRYAGQVGGARARMFLVASALEERLPDGASAVVVDDPYAALAVLLERLHPERHAPASVHPTAVVGRGVRLGAGVTLGPYAVLGDGVEIGDGTRVGAHCVVGERARVGRDGVLHPHVVVYPEARIGDRVILHSGVRIGSDGFGFALVDGHPRKIRQVGGCTVGDDVEIGANSAVDRGSLGETRLGDEVKIDNLVQVAHNVAVGSRTMMAALVGIAGSTRIGEGAWLGGQVSAINHLEIGDGARLAFGSTVMRDVAPGETVSGSPARPHRESLRKLAHLERLPKLVERVEALEARLSALEAGSAGSPGAA